MRGIVLFAGLALAAAAVVPGYLERMQGNAGRAAPTALAVQTKSTAAVAPGNGNGSVVIPPDSRGHFLVDGRVDGRRVSFMIDTGASVITLTATDAAALGIHPAQRDFSAVMGTANGTVRGAPVQLDMVEVGDLIVRDVGAVVLPDQALSTNLLGMSFLSRLRRFEYDAGKLVLEQ
jgi:aspartyl protease family protein